MTLKEFFKSWTLLILAAALVVGFVVGFYHVGIKDFYTGQEPPTPDASQNGTYILPHLTNPRSCGWSNEVGVDGKPGIAIEIVFDQGYLVAGSKGIIFRPKGDPSGTSDITGGLNQLNPRQMENLLLVALSHPKKICSYLQ